MEDALPSAPLNKEAISKGPSATSSLLDSLREEPDHQRPQAGDAQEDEDATGREDRREGRFVRQTPDF